MIWLAVAMAIGFVCGIGTAIGVLFCLPASDDHRQIEIQKRELYSQLSGKNPQDVWTEPRSPERCDARSNSTEKTPSVASVQSVVRTPGPWRVARLDRVCHPNLPNNSLGVVADPSHKQNGVRGNAAVICIIAPPEFLTPQDIENARLIAIAPKLLEGLGEALAMLRSQYEESDTPTCEAWLADLERLESIADSAC